MAEKPIHQQIAEDVLAKVKKATRDRLSLTVKSSYTAIGDEDGWIVRLTPKILEASKKRLTEEQLESAGMHSQTKPLHRKHHLGQMLALASIEDGVARQGEEAELEDAGLEEVVAVVEAGAKPVKKSTKSTKSAGKGGEAK